MTIPVPAPRWGARFTPDPTHDLEYLQQSYDEDPSMARRGELFINEPLEELYYVDGTGVARRAGDSSSIPLDRIDLTGIREFETDEDAAGATPPVPVGGMYHYQGALRVRLV